MVSILQRRRPRHRRLQLRRQAAPALASIPRISSTPTSAAWTPTPSRSSWPAGSSPTASSTQFVADRYASFDTGYGRDIEKRRVGFRELNKLVLSKLGEPKPRSGKQEYLENLLNTYLHG